jgi:hypothetical protein
MERLLSLKPRVSPEGGTAVQEPNRVIQVRTLGRGKAGVWMVT